MTEGPTTNGTRDGFRQLEFGLATVNLRWISALAQGQVFHQGCSLSAQSSHNEIL
jgi:hypothetical protein